MTQHKSQKLAKQTTELAVAAPQVIARRLHRMALAGVNPSAKDLREFYGMGAEKMLAVQQSWMAMSCELTSANQRLIMSMFTAKPIPSGFKPAALFSPDKMQRTVLDLMNKGIAPFRKKAVSNARRLGRQKS